MCYKYHKASWNSFKSNENYNPGANSVAHGLRVKNPQEGHSISNAAQEGIASESAERELQKYQILKKTQQP